MDDPYEYHIMCKNFSYDKPCVAHGCSCKYLPIASCLLCKFQVPYMLCIYVLQHSCCVVKPDVVCFGSPTLVDSCTHPMQSANHKAAHVTI